MMSKKLPGYSELGHMGLNWSPDATETGPSPDGTQVRPRRRWHNAWQKLEESIPKTESEWQRVRQTHGFSTSEEMRVKVNTLLNRECDDTVRKFIDIASSYVIGQQGEPKAGYDRLHSLLENDQLSELTLNKYTTSVLKIIKLMDELFYQGLRHRAFEIVLLCCE